MENAQEILVVILSSFLALFLLLGIILFVICIKIANHIKHITVKAEDIVDKAEGVADFFSKAATPMAIGRIITNITDAVRGKGKKRSKDDE